MNEGSSYLATLKSFAPKFLVKRVSEQKQNSLDYNPKGNLAFSSENLEDVEDQMVDIQLIRGCSPQKLTSSVILEITLSISVGDQHSSKIGEDLDLDVEERNKYMAKIINEVEKQRGDIISLKRDKILVLWSSMHLNEGISTVILRAVKCARLICINSYSTLAYSSDDIVIPPEGLEVFCTISSGTIFTFLMGQSNYHACYTGEPLLDLDAARFLTHTDSASLRKNYNVFITKKSLSYVSRWCSATQLHNNIYGIDIVSREVSTPLSFSTSSLRTSSASITESSSSGSVMDSTQLQFSLRAFIPLPVLAKIDLIYNEILSPDATTISPNSSLEIISDKKTTLIDSSMLLESDSEVRVVTIVAISIPNCSNSEFCKTIDVASDALQDAELQKSSDLLMTDLDCSVNLQDSNNSKTPALSPLFDPNLSKYLSRLSTIVNTIELLLSHYQGNIEYIHVGAKSTIISLTFSLFPMVHEDDPLRAVLVAIQLKSMLPGSTFGISTGKSLNYFTGSSKRRSFVMSGATPRIAFELMNLAQTRSLKYKGEEILCDEETNSKAKMYCSRFYSICPTFQKITMDGSTIKSQFLQQLKLYKPIAGSVATPEEDRKSMNSNLQRRKSTITKNDPFAESAVGIMGRLEERKHLQKQVNDLMKTARSSVCIVSGDIGVGKTNLIEWFKTTFDDKIEILSGSATALGHSVLYNPWKGIFMDMFRKMEIEGSEAIREYIWNQLLMENMDKYGCLLNGVLDVQFPITEVVEKMTFHERTNKTTDLLLNFLQDPTQSNRVFILENAQWFDNPTWELLFKVVGMDSADSNLLIIITGRPIDTRPELTERILTCAANSGWETGTLAIKYLSDSCILDLVSAHIGLKTGQAPPTILSPFFAQANGHPLLAIEMANYLIDSEIYKPFESDQKQIIHYQLEDIPYSSTTFQGMISCRMDRLLPSQQTALRLASVMICSKFSVDTLAKIHPQPVDAEDFSQTVKILLRTKFFEVSGMKKFKNEVLDVSKCFEDSSFEVKEDTLLEFRHQLYKTTVYDTIPPLQAKKLHRSLAHFYESQVNDAKYSGDNNTRLEDYKLIADHFSRAGRHLNALKYFAMAGDLASKISPQVLILCYSRAIEESEKNKDDTEEKDEIAVAGWERKIAEAWISLGDREQSVVHIKNALRILGVDMEGRGKESCGKKGALFGKLPTFRGLKKKLKDYVAVEGGSRISSARGESGVARSVEVNACLGLWNVLEKK